MNLEIDIQKEENRTIVILSGEIDVYTAGRLKEQLLPLTNEEGSTIQVDLGQITFLDSTGLGVFISAYKSAQKNNCNLEFIRLRDRVLRLFQVTGLHEIMNLKPIEREEEY